jgi:hypothetical protein
VRDNDVDLYNFARLRQDFGAFVEAPGTIPGQTEHDLVGDDYRRMLADTAKIIRFQWSHHIEHSALKGFLFHGGVGIGKTAMAKRLTYELCHEFGDTGPDRPNDDEVVMILADGGDVARGLYGDTEVKLRELFDLARNGSRRNAHRHDESGQFHMRGEDPIRRTILLLDDVESLFLSRNAQGAKEWHFSQDAVFFHHIDELDTAHVAIVLTTNRIDLVDDAIIDRFLPYAFGQPTIPALLEVARSKGAIHGLSEQDLEPVFAQIRVEGAVKSMREVERLVMRRYVDKILA